MKQNRIKSNHHLRRRRITRMRDDADLDAKLTAQQIRCVSPQIGPLIMDWECFTPEGCDNRSPQLKLWVKIYVIIIKPQRGDTFTVLKSSHVTYIPRFERTHYILNERSISNGRQ